MPRASAMALVCGPGPRFALAQPIDSLGPPPPKGSIEVRETQDARMVLFPFGDSVHDWMARDDGALLCATHPLSRERQVVLVTADGVQHVAPVPAWTCDFALDGRHVLCADPQNVSLLRLPDLALVQRHAGHARWLRAIDPVLAIAYSIGNGPVVLTVWHVPTLQPLAQLSVDDGPYEPMCAAVDRHRRWLAIAANQRVKLFAIVR